MGPIAALPNPALTPGAVPPAEVSEVDPAEVALAPPAPPAEVAPTEVAPTEVAPAEVAPTEVPLAGPATSPPAGPAWGRWLRRLLGAVVVGGGAYAIYNQRHQVVAGAALLGHLDWAWLVAACAAELASMIAFAHIMRWLLRAGGVRLGLFPMTGITFAGNAMTVSLPGGVAWGASYAFDQLRRRGADRTLAVWVVLASGALDSFALFVLIVIGVWGAGSTGPARDLRLPAAVLAAIPVLAAVVLFSIRHSVRCHRAGSTVLRWLGGHLRGGERVGRWLSATGSRLGAVQPDPWEWAASSAFAVANGVFDCACLVLSMLALGIAVPWRGLLVAYCLAQISAALPITPGGLGLVEGSMSLALIAYGVHTDDAVAAVLLYRIISFWALVPIGWGAWGALAYQARRARGEGRPRAWPISP